MRDAADVFSDRVGGRTPGSLETLVRDATAAAPAYRREFALPAEQSDEQALDGCRRR